MRNCIHLAKRINFLLWRPHSLGLALWSLPSVVTGYSCIVMLSKTTPRHLRISDYYHFSFRIRQVLVSIFKKVPTFGSEKWPVYWELPSKVILTCVGSCRVGRMYSMPRTISSFFVLGQPRQFSLTVPLLSWQLYKWPLIELFGHPEKMLGVNLQGIEVNCGSMQLRSDASAWCRMSHYALETT